MRVPALVHRVLAGAVLILTRLGLRRQPNTLLSKFARTIETGMVVDTTMPVSILAEAFRKCHDAKQLRELVALAFPCVLSQNHPLPRLDADLHAPSGLFSGRRLWGLEVRR
jgi:hypothetical protein